MDLESGKCVPKVWIRYTGPYCHCYPLIFPLKTQNLAFPENLPSSHHDDDHRPHSTRQTSFKRRKWLFLNAVQNDATTHLNLVERLVLFLLVMLIKRNMTNQNDWHRSCCRWQVSHYHVLLARQSHQTTDSQDTCSRLVHPVKCKRTIIIFIYYYYY